MKSKIDRKYLVKFPYIKFHENFFSGFGKVLQTDWKIDFSRCLSGNRVSLKMVLTFYSLITSWPKPPCWLWKGYRHCLCWQVYRRGKEIASVQSELIFFEWKKYL